jgi:hypothetical protein
MTTKFIETESRNEAKKAAPWAAKIVRVCGGYMAFQSITDWKTWKNQK